MRFWFRGTDDANFTLNPGLLRPPYIGSNLDNIEHSISTDFNVRGRSYMPSPPKNDWEQMFLMQHYGFPTRLLDWSESLATAAYFAARDVQSSCDGAVWVLAPQWLIFRAHALQATHLPSNDRLLQPYALRTAPTDDIESFNKLPPLPILPDFLDKRIIAQRGRFTIHTFQPDSLETLAVQDRQQYSNACFLHMIRIPAASKGTIRQQVHLFGGATEDTLFPDLEGLSRGIRWAALEKEQDRIGSR